MANQITFFEHTHTVAPSESERNILHVIVQNEGISQPEIAQKTGLAQQSVSRIVKSLIDREILCLGERRAKGKRGQPSVTVQVNPKFAYTFGLSIMTDAITVVLMNFAGDVIEQQHFEMSDMSRHNTLNKVKSVTAAILENYKISYKRVLGLGVGISGYCLDGKARFNTPRLLDDWALVDLDKVISTELEMPVWAENDGNAAAIGESLVGIGHTHPSFVYIYLAAGLGGGVINNRELIKGSNGNAGELGLILPSSTHAPPTIELLREILNEDGHDFETMSEMLQNFDVSLPGNDRWIEKTKKDFAFITSAIAAILDPDAIVIGGRIPSDLAEKLIPHIEIYDHIRRSEPRPLPRLIVSHVEGDAAAIGAAAIPFKKTFF